MLIIAKKDDVILRHARPEDFVAIDHITITCYTPIYESFIEMVGREAYQEIYYDPENPWPENKTSQNHRLFKEHPEWIWVLEKRGEVFGYVSFKLRPGKNYGIFDNNAVLPSHGDQGWGKFMYRHVLKYFRSLGIRFALVETGLDDAHIPARKAYEGVGFDHQDRITIYYQDLDKFNAGSDPKE
ncbi:MAG: GNAT family N-acetyltransferase [Candidatus Thorarchaeota archaeon]